MPTLLAFDGVDASGKTTQALLMYERLKNSGYNVKYITFPDYESESSALAKMYLNGEFGENPHDVNPYAASSFYSVDRFASYMKNWKDFYRLENSVVIANRYTTANAVHQTPKLPKNEWAGFLDWLYDFEFSKLAIPRPDLTVFFDMHTDLSLKLLKSRSKENHIPPDIHERDADYLRKSYEAARFAAAHLKWETLKCYDDTNGVLTVKPREIILDELTDLIFAKTEMKRHL